MRALPARLLLACVAAAALPAAAAAQAVASEPLALDVIQPFTIVKLADLEFGAVSVASAGTIDIDPATGVRSFAGGVTPAGSAYSAARFHTRGDPNGTVRIRISTKKVDLLHSGGTATLQLDRLRHEFGKGKGKKHRLDSNGDLVFNIGGRVRLEAGQPPGRYEGTFEVETTYQ